LHSWTGWQATLRVANRFGVDLLPVTWGTATSVKNMRYGKGSFMLDWDGRHGAFSYCIATCYTNADPWKAIWTRNLGRPRAPKKMVLHGVYRRNFAHGTVVVNTTPDSVVVRANGKRRTISPTDAYIAQSGRPFR
jgi:hypothetical protein